MKLSRFSVATLLLLIITALSGCTESKEKGIAMAQDFVKAWNSDDDSLNIQVEKINSALDSITFKSPFVNAFIEEATKADSTMTLAAQVLLNDGNDVTSQLCDEIIDGLASDKLNYTQASAKIMQLAEVCSKLKKEDLNKAFGQQLDSKASALSLDKQMKVYSSATTPEKLGSALKEDASQPNADKGLINSQVEALKNIYNAQDYKKFIDAYQK